METPKEYAKRKLKENSNMKSLARIFINNMLYNSFIQTDKDFYSCALDELDSL
jgi:hypothetical protein